MGNWTLTSGASTQSFAKWGVKEVTRSRAILACDKVTFRAEGRPVDAAPIFAQWSTVTIHDPAGNPWFTGIVTKVPVSGSPRAEQQHYEVSGPWWYLENLVFQQIWKTTNGIDTTLISSLRSMIILNQDLTLTLIDLGAVATAVLNYVLTTAASYAPPFVPFALGANTITTKIPFTEVKDKSCAQIMTTIFAWVPDVIVWFDYTTTPPTLHIKRRGELDPVDLPAFGPPMAAIDITPRADLVVPAVVCKYNTPESVDGRAWNVQDADIYPPGALDPAFRNLVLDLDLEGGQATYQKQDLVTTDRPIDYNALAGTGALISAALSWLKGEHRADWLKGYTIPAGTDPDQVAYGSPGNNTLNDIHVNVDETKLTILSVITTLVDNSKVDPTTGKLELPSGSVPPGGGPGTKTGGVGNALDYLTAEILEGTVTPWMTSDQNVYSARVRIEVTLAYTGDDPVIIALFGGTKFAVKKIAGVVNVTNGSTQTYSQPTSVTPAESVPTGLAQLLYEGLSVLHYQGSVKLIEQECGGLVGLHNTLNLTGSLQAAWATMKAQVYEIIEKLDTGETTLRLGPPKALTGQEWVDWLKASRGRIQTYHSGDRTTGQSGADNSVQGAGTVAATALILPPSLSPAHPWRISWRHKSGGGFEIKVSPESKIFAQLGPYALIHIDNLDTWMTCTPAVSGGDAVWIKCTVASYSVTAAAIGSIGNGNGADFDYTITDPWVAKSWVQDNAGSPPSQTFFYVLLGTIISDINGNPVVFHERTKNLTVTNRNIGGQPAIFVEN